ncbi:hypothetical protein SALBM135S_07427 [Streptomyces alboniger]
MPREPFSGMHGTMPALRTATSLFRFAGVIAEFPRANDTMRESMMVRAAVSSK